MNEADDILKALREKGIPVGEWSARPKTDLGQSVFGKQIEILEGLRSLLQGQIEQDLVKEAELQDALTRVEKAKEVTRGRR